MRAILCQFLLILVLLNFSLFFTNGADLKPKLPTIGISILVRNKEHALPYFFTCLQGLDYPKERLYVWIYSDHNQDNSITIVEDWITKYGHEYNNVHFTKGDTSYLHPDEEKPTHWTPLHYKHVIKIREEALDFARKHWADYIFMLDADIFLRNPSTLRTLVSKNYEIVAPMLTSDGMYSNFWCGMTNNFYYKRTDDYRPILSRETKGCFQVPMVHSAVLINLRTTKSDRITYDSRKVENYNGPQDDVIAFAINVQNNGIPQYICNDVFYGFLPVPLEDNEDIENDYEQVLNVKMEAISHGLQLPVADNLVEHVLYPEMWKFECDEIYMINLERRHERRDVMVRSFKEMGMDATIFKAIDGKDLDMKDLKKHSIKLMPTYEDPYHRRPMKAGEIGCFLSHYQIWKEVVKKGFKITLVLEDDIHFMPYFRSKLLNLLIELNDLDWDLTYIGRKILMNDEEIYVAPHIVKPLYSYWTLGYLVSLQGAKKLLAAEPLSKMLPVDEFLPIMFDQHPNSTWKSYFWSRNLKAFSAAPLLVYPTHYTGDQGYISDTEDSHIVNISSPPPMKVDL